MIKFLQSGNRAAKYILAGFLFILAGSMVIYLIPNFMSGNEVTQSGVVASVGGHEISRDDVQRLSQRMTRGQQIPDFYRKMLYQQAIQQLVRQAALSYEAERMGLRVTDKELRDELQNSSPYKEAFFPDGKWVGGQQYKSILSQSNLTVEQFENGMKEDLLRQKLISVVTANAVVSDAEVQQAYKDKNTKVKVQYAIIQLDDVLKTIKPTDTELKAYFDANQPKYQNGIPEKRQIKYFVVNDADITKDVTVDPAQIQSYYKDHQDSFRVPTRVKLRHILIGFPPAAPGGTLDQKAVDEARAKAQDVLKQVKAGGDFAQLANKYSTDPGNEDPKTHVKRGGELPWFTQGAESLDPEFAKVAFAQAKGQTSDLVQSQFGFHIIRTEDKEGGHVKPLADVRKEIEDLLKKDKVSALLNQTSSDLARDAQKLGLEKAAAKYHAQVEETKPVERTDSLAGIGAQPALMDAVFTTEANAEPQIARIKTGYVVYQVTKIEPPRKPSFEEFKDRVATEFKNERANDILRRKTQEMADRAHAEHNLAKAAKDAGATLKDSELVTRSSTVAGLGSMSGPAGVAFSLKQGEISGPLNLGASAGVLQVVERQEPSASDPQFATERDQLREQLVQQKRQELEGRFQEDLSMRLQKEGKIKINQAEFDNLTKSRS
jgi:peptidyl-prolyl cis-trans isomerase D